MPCDIPLVHVVGASGAQEPFHDTPLEWIEIVEILGQIDHTSQAVDRLEAKSGIEQLARPGHRGKQHGLGKRRIFWSGDPRGVGTCHRAAMNAA